LLNSWIHRSAVVVSLLAVCQPAISRLSPTEDGVAEVREALRLMRNDALIRVPDAQLIAAASKALTAQASLAPEAASRITDEKSLLKSLREALSGAAAGNERDLIGAVVTALVRAADESGRYGDLQSWTRTWLEADREGLLIKAIQEDWLEPGQLAVGDRILAVNGQDVRGLRADEVAARIEGEAGSLPSVTYVRGDQAPQVITLQRRAAAPAQVSSRLVGSIGVVTIPSFRGGTPTRIADEMASLDERHPGLRGFILDLRGNRGGEFGKVLECADLFLVNGPIGSQQGRQQRDVEHYVATRGEIAQGRSLIVLVDSLTANGAEIFVSALQSAGRARVVGEPTQGHGGIQTLIPVSSRASVLLTTAQFVKADGVPLKDHGIVPDVRVQLQDGSTDAALDAAIKLFDAPA
jgi:C-terminal peptidase prc